MSTGGWDKRQWEALQDITITSPSGSRELKTAPPNNLLGIGPHDYVEYTYLENVISQIKYFTGGLQESGTLVATVNYSYDVSGNVTSIERVYP